MWHRIAQRRNPVKLLQYSCIIINSNIKTSYRLYICTFMVRVHFRENINLIETFYASGHIWYIWCSVGCKACRVALLHFKRVDAFCILFRNIMRTSIASVTHIYIYMIGKPVCSFFFFLVKKNLIISYTAVRDHKSLLKLIC